MKGVQRGIEGVYSRTGGISVFSGPLPINILVPMVLNLRSIQAWASPATVALGARDLKEGRVSGLRKAADALWSGQVRGSKDHPFSVEIDLGPRGEHFCEGACDGICRHIVALALAIAEKSGETGSATAHCAASSSRAERRGNASIDQACPV